MIGPPQLKFIFKRNPINVTLLTSIFTQSISVILVYLIAYIFVTMTYANDNTMNTTQRGEL
jgi:hypothetical protein